MWFSSCILTGSKSIIQCWWWKVRESLKFFQFFHGNLFSSCWYINDQGGGPSTLWLKIRSIYIYMWYTTYMNLKTVKSYWIDLCPQQSSQTQRWDVISKHLKALSSKKEANVDDVEVRWRLSLHIFTLSLSNLSLMDIKCSTLLFQPIFRKWSWNITRSIKISGSLMPSLRLLWSVSICLRQIIESSALWLNV